MIKNQNGEECYILSYKGRKMKEIRMKREWQNKLEWRMTIESDDSESCIHYCVLYVLNGRDEN